MTGLHQLSPGCLWKITVFILGKRSVFEHKSVRFNPQCSVNGPSMDPNIAKMIERSRARSSAKKGPRPVESSASKLSPRKFNIEVEQPRSPLKPRNYDAVPEGSRSPSKKGLEIPDSPSDTIKRLLKRESLETSVKDLLARWEEIDFIFKYLATIVMIITPTLPPRRSRINLLYYRRHNEILLNQPFRVKNNV